MCEELPLGFFCEIWKFSSLMVFPEFDDGDSGYVVEIEDTVDLDPLEPNEVIVTAEGRSEVVPYILSDKVILVLGESELNLQAPFLLA